MKRLILAIVLLLSCLSSAQNFSAFANGTATTTGVAPLSTINTINSITTNHVLIFTTTGSPASVSIQIQGSTNNGTSYSICGSASTSTSAAIISCTGTYDHVQVNVNTLSGGTSPTIVWTLGSQLTTPISGTITESNLPTTVDTNSGNKSASTLRVVLATDQPQLTSKLLVTPDSVALPANQSVNAAQVGGTNTDTNSGAKSAGTLRVVLATDQPQLTNKLLVTPDSVALPANQSVNAAQVGGTNTDTNSGAKSAGTLRVVLATDQPQLTNKFLVTPDSVALPANQSVNVAQMNGVTTSMGSGPSNTGTQRIVPATDQPFPTLNGAPSTSNAAGGFQDAGGVARPGAVNMFPTSNATNAIGPTVNGSVGSSLILKASAGNLYDAYATAGATSGLLMIFDATSAPVDGAVTPKHCIPVAANGTGSFTFGSAPPESYATGITLVYSSGTNCFSKTASATAFLHGRAQ